MIKILVADDSPTILEYTEHILVSSGGFDVVGTAKDGVEAVALARATNPDVILMDINMPRMNGYEATREIMETKPVPIVIFSAGWKPEHVAMTFQAMEAGALAVLEKPRGPGSPDAEPMIRELVQTARLMSEVPVVRRHRRRERTDALIGLTPQEEKRVSEATALVAMGASTGGPPALATILSALPKDFSVPILVVQHISVGFLGGLVEWLGRACDVSVRAAKHGETLEPGCVYVAPDNLHMGVMGKARVALSDAAPINSVRPSVSHLFRSVSQGFGKRAVGVLLTGMGKDGADGLKSMKESGAITVAQNEESCVVFGMPGAAKEIDAVSQFLDPEGIAALLVRLTR